MTRWIRIFLLVCLTAAAAGCGGDSIEVPEKAAPHPGGRPTPSGTGY